MIYKRVSATEEIHMSIPLHFLNEDTCPCRLKLKVLTLLTWQLKLKFAALASNLPQFIEVDLAKLSAGQSIHLSDLALPAGVKLEKIITWR